MRDFVGTRKKYCCEIISYSELTDKRCKPILTFQRESNLQERVLRLCYFTQNRSLGHISGISKLQKPRRGLLYDNPGLRRRSTLGVCHLPCKHSGRVPSRNVHMMIADSPPGSLFVWFMSEGTLNPLRGFSSFAPRHRKSKLFSMLSVCRRFVPPGYRREVPFGEQKLNLYVIPLFTYF